MPSTRSTPSARRARQHEAARDRRHAEAKRALRYRNEFGRAVESLTNWQRTKWAGAGYPGLREKDADQVLPFAILVRAVIAATRPTQDEGERA